MSTWPFFVQQEILIIFILNTLLSGQIKDRLSGDVLGFLTNEADDHFEVILQQPKQDIFGKKWQRSEANSEGWFTLHCVEAKAFLTNAPSDYLIVAGNWYILICYQFS